MVKTFISNNSVKVYVSQPKISKNKKDPDYDSHIKKGPKYEPSNLGTTEQPIVNSSPIAPGLSIGNIIFTTISFMFFAPLMILMLAQIAGVIDVTGFLNPDSPTYLNLDSVLFPNNENEEDYLYDEVMPGENLGNEDAFPNPFKDTTLVDDDPSPNTSADICERYRGTSCEVESCCCEVIPGSGSPASNGMPAMPDAILEGFIVPKNCECPIDMTDAHSPQATPMGMYKMCLCNC